MANENQSLYHKNLRGKAVSTISCIEKSIEAFFGPNIELRGNAIHRGYDAVLELSTFFSDSHRPKFLKLLERYFQQALKAPDSADAGSLMHAVLKELLPELESYDWDLDDQDPNPGYDIDAVFEKYRDEYGIPKLFDKIIEYLEKILKTSEIDSRAAVKKLEKIIAALKNARNGSHLSMQSAWSFTVVWLKHSFNIWLEDSPAIGPVIKGFHEAVKETDAKVYLVNQKVYEAIGKEFKSEIPKIEHTPVEMPALENLDQDAEEADFVVKPKGE